MLKIQIQGRPYALSFKHVKFTQPQTNLIPSERPVRAHTSAIIRRFKEDGKVNFDIPAVAYGIAFCSKDDKFEKEKGRRLALQKALSQVSREERKNVFRQYEGRRILHQES